jgi:hypothetical protein
VFVLWEGLNTAGWIPSLYQFLCTFNRYECGGPNVGTVLCTPRSKDYVIAIRLELSGQWNGEGEGEGRVVERKKGKRGDGEEGGRI